MDRDHGKSTTTSGICESFWLECFSIDFLDNFGDQCIYGGHLASSQSFDSVFVPFFVLFSVYTFPNLGIELGREAVGKWLLIENLWIFRWIYPLVATVLLIDSRENVLFSKY